MYAICHRHAAITAIALLTLTATVRADYPYGIKPAGADPATVKQIYAAWKDSFVTSESCPEPDNMLRTDDWGQVTSLTMAQAMLFAAFLEDTDEALRKLWNFAEVNLNGAGLLHPSFSSDGTVMGDTVSKAGADMDIAIALDRAAIRWPESSTDWDDLAQKYIGAIRRTKVDKWDLVADNQQGYYLHQNRTNYMRRFRFRTGKQRWGDVYEASVALIVPTLQAGYKLPPYQVDYRGAPIDTVNSNRWTEQSTLSLFQYAHNALMFGERRAEGLAKRAVDFFAELGAETDIEKIKANYRYTDGGELQNGLSTYTIGAAGIAAMAAGNQELADKAWDYCVSYNDEWEDITAKAIRILYLYTMSGGFDLRDTVKGKLPPSIDSLLAPTSFIFSKDEDIQFRLKVSPGFAEVDRITFRLGDSTVIGKIAGASADNEYTFTWSGAPGGTSDLFVRAADAKPRVSEPLRVSIMVGDPLQLLPYSGTPVEIPGTIWAAEYDRGGEGIGYHDNSPENKDNEFRTLEAVDLEATNDTLDAGDVRHYHIAHTQPESEPEWLAYTINVTATDTYDIVVDYSSEGDECGKVVMKVQDYDPATLMDFQGAQLGDTIVPCGPTQSWFEFHDEAGTKGAYLTEGLKRLRMTFVEGVNINTIRIGKDISSVRGIRGPAGAAEMPRPRIVGNGVVRIANPRQVQRLLVLDPLGRVLHSYDHSAGIPRTLDLSTSAHGPRLIAVVDFAGRTSQTSLTIP